MGVYSADDDVIRTGLASTVPVYYFDDYITRTIIMLCSPRFSTVFACSTQNSAAARGMATEKQIMMRITATKNISKITQSMKMVSAAKLRGDQARLAQAQPFNVSPFTRSDVFL